MNDVNRFGLSRRIPDKVKRAVRQRNGFGCVICGKAIYEYDHFAPEYADAKEHKAEGIVLLCSEHHSKKTRGMLSRETIEAASLDPKALRQRFSFDAFDIGTEPPEIVIGSLVAEKVRVLIRLDGDDVLSILPPEIKGAPFRINARLMDREGKVIFEIFENEWRTPCENWDVEVTGTRITIRRGIRDVLMQLRSEPPHRLVFEKLDMNHRGFKVFFEEGKSVEVTTPDGTRLGVGSLKISGFEVALCVSNNRIVLGDNPSLRPTTPIVNASPKQRRNDPCHCGSGIKFKKCCGKLGA